MYIVLIALLFLAACTASSPALPPESTVPPSAEDLFFDVAIEPASITAGEPMTLAVTLAAAPTELSLLRLSITYPGGHVQTVVESTYGDAATIAWTVPGDASPGKALYRLSSEGCGCGPEDKGVRFQREARVMRGEFIVEQRNR